MSSRKSRERAYLPGADGFKSKASYARPVAGLKMSSRKSRERAYLPGADGFKSKALMLSCCKAENELPKKHGMGIPSGRRRRPRLQGPMAGPPGRRRGRPERSPNQREGTVVPRHPRPEGRERAGPPNRRPHTRGKGKRPFWPVRARDRAGCRGGRQNNNGAGLR